MVIVTVEKDNICFIWDCVPSRDCKTQAVLLNLYLKDLGVEVHHDVFHAMDDNEPVHMLRST